MCGLFGRIWTEKHGLWDSEVQKIIDMYNINMWRGSDSTGMAQVAHNLEEYHVHKVKGSPYQFTEHDGWKEARRKLIQNAKLIIGHGRAATRGKVTEANAHPFVEPKADPKQQIILAHNGTLWGSQRLPDFDKYDVDSHWLAACMAKYGLDETLSKVQGALALIWWDTEDKKLRLFRNHERPLYFVVHEKDGFLSMSEQAFMAFIKYRGNMQFNVNDIKEVEARKVYEFDPNDIMNFQVKPIAYVAPPILAQSHFNMGFAGTETGPHNTMTGGTELQTRAERRRLLQGSILPTGAKSPTEAERLEMLHHDVALLRTGEVTYITYNHKKGSKYMKYNDGPGVTVYHSVPDPNVRKMSFNLANDTLEKIDLNGKVTKIPLRPAAVEETNSPKVISLKPRKHGGPDLWSSSLELRGGRIVKWATTDGKTTIRHRGLCNWEHPWYLEFYENNFEGKVKKDDWPNLEVLTVEEIGVAGTTGKMMHKVICSLVEQETSGDVLYTFFVDDADSKQDIINAAFFVARTTEMRVASKGFYQATGACVEVMCEDAVPLSGNRDETAVATVNMDNERGSI